MMSADKQLVQQARLARLRKYIHADDRLVLGELGLLSIDRGELVDVEVKKCEKKHAWMFRSSVLLTFKGAWLTAKEAETLSVLPRFIYIRQVGEICMMRFLSEVEL